MADFGLPTDILHSLGLCSVEVLVLLKKPAMPNKPDASNPAMTISLTIVDHWRRVADLESSRRLRRRERGADYVQLLVLALRARTRSWTGHREPHNQTAFDCEAHGAGQHRD